ncbi:MAG: hypothetical protein V1820_04790 [archaeon]
MEGITSPELAKYFGDEYRFLLFKASADFPEFGRQGGLAHPLSGEQFEATFYPIASALSPLSLVPAKTFSDLWALSEFAPFLNGSAQAAFAKVASEAFLSGISGFSQEDVSEIQARVLAAESMYSSIEDARALFAGKYCEEGAGGADALAAFSDAYDALIFEIPNYILPASAPKPLPAAEDFNLTVRGLVDFSGESFHFPFTGEKIVETIRDLEEAKTSVYEQLIVLGGDVCSAAFQAAKIYYQVKGAGC